jgi:multiple sugar transport system permease protein
LQSRNNLALFAKNSPTPFLLPTFVGAAIAVAIPVVALGWLSLMQWDLISPAQWAGLGNFQRVLSDAAFLRSLGNSFYISIWATLMQLTIGTVAGYLQWTKASRLVTGIYLLPWFAAPVAIGVIWKWLLTPETGILSNLLGARLDILTSSTLAPLAVAAVSVWLGFGYTAMFVAAGLRSMPTDTIEAAKLDGASGRQIFWGVQLPQLGTLALFLVVTTSLQTMGLFDIVYVLTGGGPLGATDTAALHIANSALYQFDVGGSAASAAVFTVLEGLVVLAQVLVYRGLTRRHRA